MLEKMGISQNLGTPFKDTGDFVFLEFDIEYDQALDGAIRLDAAKFPSVSWDAII